MMRFSRLAAILACSGAIAHAQSAPTRQRYSMDAQWRFALGDPPGAEQPAFNDGSWRVLTLPHDWSIEGTMRQDARGGGQAGFLPGGIAWYRKAFRLPSSVRGREAMVEFDGIYMNSDVWINGVHLGHRPYGYIGFAYDVSKQLVDGVNVVAVRVDNSSQPNSRWYSGSGIERHVWLTVVDPLHIAHWGTYVTTPRVDSASADVTVRTRVENDRAGLQRGTLRAIILDENGREVVRLDTAFAIAASQRAELAQQLRVARPTLWSVARPYLYTLRVEVHTPAGVTDTVSTPFGIRSIAFDKDRGFLLNGQHVKLNGVNLHHDAGGLGAAVPESVWERRLAVLRMMGANAVRTSHNPPAPEFLDLCDRLGFVVMDEAFDEWTVAKVPGGYHNYFAEWSERDVTDYVHRDRNHPSVVLWSAGNEIGEQSKPDGAAVLRRLVAVYHREDPTRPVTTGNDQIAADGSPATVAFLEAEDVVGYNYVDRWHERREVFAEPDRHAHPDWKMIGTESGTIFQSFDEQYSLGSDSAVVRANYTSGMMEAERRWKWVAMHDYFAGDFMWTGIDYLGEAVWPFRGFPSGVLDITGHPKDSYYLYQSQWTTRPVLHLFPHWTWTGRTGQVIPVMVYTNCNNVTLYLNGRSLGEKRLEFPAQGTSGGWNTYALSVVNATTNDLHVSWDVPYEPGVLRAAGTRRDGATCQDEVRTAGPPAAVRLVVERDTVSTAPGDVASIPFEIVDSAGVVVPAARNLVHVSAAGGDVVVLDNGDLEDQGSYREGQRRAFNGRGLAIVHATKPGVVRIDATADGLRRGSVTLTVVQGRTTPSIPAAR
ncbi:MAG TPA: glycoside hydrolase family 2 TIM barrel-domain containing protein [Gemmatimonadaceae bacterium]|nr:glycoside hydrolase family 2 TIM barrel-domain containing protein [Gemmatimonadaceae bacterium]